MSSKGASRCIVFGTRVQRGGIGQDIGYLAIHMFGSVYGCQTRAAAKAKEACQSTTFFHLEK